MGIIRVFPRKTNMTPTDDLAIIGDIPLIRPPEMPVRISVTFTWDMAEGERLYKEWSQYYSDVQLGGPAFGSPSLEFEPGMFLKKGVTITSRGCIRKCSFCLVNKREGNLRELEIKPGHIIQDNNFIACSKGHKQKVFDMLKTQRQIEFIGGIDARIFSEWDMERMSDLKLKSIWFACDNDGDQKHLERVKKILNRYNVSINKTRCYTMIGKNETIEIAEKRLKSVYSLGFLPFAQLYRDEKNTFNYSKEWKTLSATWSHCRAYRSLMEKGWRSKDEDNMTLFEGGE